NPRRSGQRSNRHTLARRSLARCGQVRSDRTGSDTLVFPQHQTGRAHISSIAQTNLLQTLRARSLPMLSNRRTSLLGVVLVGGLLVLGLIAQDKPDGATQRAKMVKAHKQGNYKDAYNGLRKLALDPKSDPLKVGDDLTLAINCLQRLGRSDETDDFR